MQRLAQSGTRVFAWPSSAPHPLFSACSASKGASNLPPGPSRGMMVPHAIHPPLARPWHEALSLEFILNSETAARLHPGNHSEPREERRNRADFHPSRPRFTETLAQNAARFGIDSRKHLAPKIQALADPEVRIKRIHPTAQALGSMRETRPKKSRGGEHGTRDRELEAGSSGFYGTNSTIAAAGSPRKSFFRGAAHGTSASSSRVPSCSMELRITTWHVVGPGCTRRCQIGKTASDRGPERHHTEKTLVPWRGMVHAG